MNPEEMLAMRKSGRTWAQVAERAKTSVADVRAATQDLRTARRDALAHTMTSERARGLLVPCKACGCLRKVHADHLGQCASCGPAFEGKDVDGYWATGGCDAFMAAKPAYEHRISGDVVIALRQLGLASDWRDLGFYCPKTADSYTEHTPRGDRLRYAEARPHMPRVRVETMVRREKKRRGIS